MQREYYCRDADERAKYYYEKRSRFNELKGNWFGVASNDVELAALFIFLNKTCFNGLCRLNRKGEFNAAHGRVKAPNICDAQTLFACRDSLRGVVLLPCDWRELEKIVDFDESTFVYVDPPYRQVDVANPYKLYTKNDFDDAEQEALAEACRRWNDSGAYVVAHNSDYPEYFGRLYEGFRIDRLEASRKISQTVEGRAKVGELIMYSKD
jgi:DNA adenine methylase